MPRLAAVTAIALLLVAACGGGGALSKEEYLERAREIARDSTTATALFTRLAAGEVTPDACRRDTRRFRNEVRRLVRRAAELRPPEEVARIHDRFVGAARETIAALDDLVADVDAGRVRCGAEWNSRAYGLASTRRAEEALARLEARGYVILGD